eukprot:CAMPEP_0114260984 /NCGR_PEP_ID=MMETSP0058-20121206/20839_1 /TAXON_ID=36894 /ORGANISM="Pyramimonas parkeae, CCMP726" /LENGTH=491 /DNA_ID=CAMNT_0001376377 /DNA_START=184 /DNA_END=1659 /DNA_ORIENTATION=+
MCHCPIRLQGLIVALFALRSFGCVDSIQDTVESHVALRVREGPPLQVLGPRTVYGETILDTAEAHSYTYHRISPTWRLENLRHIWHSVQVKVTEQEDSCVLRLLVYECSLNNTASPNVATQVTGFRAHPSSPIVADLPPFGDAIHVRVHCERAAPAGDACTKGGGWYTIQMSNDFQPIYPAAYIRGDGGFLVSALPVSVEDDLLPDERGDRVHADVSGDAKPNHATLSKPPPERSQQPDGVGRPGACSSAGKQPERGAVDQVALAIPTNLDFCDAQKLGDGSVRDGEVCWSGGMAGSQLALGLAAVKCSMVFDPLHGRVRPAVAETLQLTTRAVAVIVVLLYSASRDPSIRMAASLVWAGSLVAPGSWILSLVGRCVFCAPGVFFAKIRSGADNHHESMKRCDGSAYGDPEPHISPAPMPTLFTHRLCSDEVRRRMIRTTHAQMDMLKRNLEFQTWWRNAPSNTQDCPVDEGANSGSDGDSDIVGVRWHNE